MVMCCLCGISCVSPGRLRFRPRQQQQSGGSGRYASSKAADQHGAHIDALQQVHAELRAHTAQTGSQTGSEAQQRRLLHVVRSLQAHNHTTIFHRLLRACMMQGHVQNGEIDAGWRKHRAHRCCCKVALLMEGLHRTSPAMLQLMNTCSNDIVQTLL